MSAKVKEDMYLRAGRTQILIASLKKMTEKQFTDTYTSLLIHDFGPALKAARKYLKK